MVKRDYLSCFVLFFFLCINLTKFGIMFLLTLLVKELVGLDIFCKLPLSFVVFRLQKHIVLCIIATSSHAFQCCISKAMNMKG